MKIRRSEELSPGPLKIVSHTMDNIPSLSTQMKKAIGELRDKNWRAQELRATVEESLGEQLRILADGFNARFQELNGVLDSLNGAVQEMGHRIYVVEELMKAKKAREWLVHRAEQSAPQPAPAPVSAQPGVSTASGTNNILADAMQMENIPLVDVELDPNS